MIRIPDRIVLPFGYVVKVKLVTAEEMEEAGGEGCDGLWRVEERTIYVRKSLPARRRRWVLVHEAFHALLDAQHHYVNTKVIDG